MPGESLDASENLPKERRCQMTFSQLEELGGNTRCPRASNKDILEILVLARGRTPTTTRLRRVK